MRDFIDREITEEIAQVEAMEENCLRLVATAANLYTVDPEDVLAGSRKPQVIRARQAACWLLRHRTRLSLPAIGRILGCDHTTVLYSVRKVEASAAVRALLNGVGAAA